MCMSMSHVHVACRQRVKNERQGHAGEGHARPAIATDRRAHAAHAQPRWRGGSGGGDPATYNMCADCGFCVPLALPPYHRLDAELAWACSSISQRCWCSAPKAVVLYRAVFGSKRKGPVDSAAQAVVKAPRRIERDKRHLTQCVGGPCQ